AAHASLPLAARRRRAARRRAALRPEHRCRVVLERRGRPDRLRRQMTAGTAANQRESIRADLGPRVRRWPRSPVFYGLVAAPRAVAVGESLGVPPPAACALCPACPGRNPPDWIANHPEGKNLFVRSAGAGWPFLTGVGLVVGSFAAPRRNGEFSSINLG